MELAFEVRLEWYCRLDPGRFEVSCCGNGYCPVEGLDCGDLVCSTDHLGVGEDML